MDSSQASKKEVGTLTSSPESGLKVPHLGNQGVEFQFTIVGGGDKLTAVYRVGEGELQVVHMKKGEALGMAELMANKLMEWAS